MARAVVVGRGVHLLILLIILPVHRGVVQELVVQVLRLALREQRALREIQEQQPPYFVCPFVAEQGALEGTQEQPDVPAIRGAKALLGQTRWAVIEGTQTTHLLTPAAVKEKRVRNTMCVFVLLSALSFKRNRLAVVVVAELLGSPLLGVEIRDRLAVTILVVRA